MGSKKRMKRTPSIKSHDLKLVSKTMLRMSTFKNLAKSHPEHDLRREEWHEWEHGDYLIPDRQVLTGLSWAAVVVFVLIPLVFCVMYSLRFSEEIAWMWLNEILQDLLLGWLGLNFVSLFVSLMAGFAYVKLYPLILGLSKTIAAVHPTQVSPVS